MPFIDHVQNIAARKAGTPSWRWCSLERVGEDSIIVTGGIPTEVFKSGPRKGRTNWSKVQQSKLVVTDAELQTERESCLGTGLAPGASTMTPREEAPAEVDPQSSLF